MTTSDFNNKHHDKKGFNKCTMESALEKRNEEGAESENSQTIIPKSFVHKCAPKDFV